MAYQSIFSGGNNQISAKQSGQAAAITAGFTPGKYASINAQIAAQRPVNPASITDVPTLQAALKSGHITTDQFVQRFSVIKNQPLKANPYSVGNLAGALGNAANKVFVAPVVAAGKDTASQTVKLAKQITAAPATGQQRQAVITNQSAAAKNPEYVKATQGINPKNNSASGVIQAQKMATQGMKAADIRAFLLKDAAALNAQTQKGVNALSVATALPVGSGGTLGRAITSSKAALGDAKQAALLAAARKANAGDTLAQTAVTEAKTQRVPVVGATGSVAGKAKLGAAAVQGEKTVPIPVKGTSRVSVGKVTPQTDAGYIAASNKLSKQYETDLAKVKQVPHPITQQVLQRQLDTKYTQLQANLDKKFGQTNVTFGKSTPVKTPELPKSALDATTPVKPTPVTSEPKLAAPAAPKPKAVTTTIPAEKPTTAPPKTPQTVPGEPKVAGSALRTQQKAVEAGMQRDLQGATFNTVSHKAEAAKAVQLVNENPQKALDIAMGRTAADNSSHESAVYHAVTNQAVAEAKKTGDFSKVTELANSPHHTGVSEAAQKLGAEGYNNPHDPVKLMADVAKTRQKAVLKRGNTVEKEAVAVGKAVQAAKPAVSRQDWHAFVESLKC